ncbi:MAG: outer membrane protein assembly factor BamB, partial [Burkholderiaceae bacterium]
MPLVPVARARAAIVLVASALLLGACSGGGPRPKPAELGTNTPLLGVRQAWTSRVGEQPLGAMPVAVGSMVVLAGMDGTVAAVDASDGRDQWRASLGTALATGAGSDGRLAAVITRNNEVVAIDNGKEIWRAKLPAQSFTAPLVAGGRVFALAADRSVTAFDGASGRKLWVQQRPGEPLILKQSGTLLAVGDTLVAGLSGRLVGLNPNNGGIRWETPIASPRGTNDIERLVDLVGRTSRVGEVVCARAFQAAVGCVNTARGNLVWAKPANGAEGLAGDDRLVFGTEADGKVVAWRRADGERAWVVDRLQYRSLSAPLAVGRSVVFGDNSGNVHFLSREDGSALNRLATDSSGVAAGPVLAGDTLVVVTRNGGVYG